MYAVNRVAEGVEEKTKQFTRDDRNFKNNSFCGRKRFGQITRSEPTRDGREREMTEEDVQKSDESTE